MSILNVDKIQPIGGGSTITVDATDIQATSATITASKFVGSGDLSVTGVSTFTGNIDANGDIDVDGHTNLDNVSIAGVSTFSGNLDINASVDISGDLQIPDKIIHTGDSNTMIRFPAADAFSVETAGNEAIRVDNGGRLLIGRTGSMNGGILCVGTGQGNNPVSGEGVKLAPSANTITFLDSNSNGSDTGNIQFWNTVYNNCSAKIEFYHPAGNIGGIKFHTKPAAGGTPVEALRIDHESIIWANHSNPLSSSLMILDKDGSGEAQLRFYNAGSNKAQIALDNSEELTFDVNGGERLRITSSGEVLIGRTTKPNDINKLVVTGTSPADAYDSQLYLEGSETSGAINTGGSIGFGGHDGGTARNWANIYGMKENGTGSNYAAYMSFHTRPAGGGPTERLRIDSTGALGLGGTPKNNSGNYRQLQIGLGAHFYGRTDDTPIHLLSNGYRDGSNWKYTANTTVSQIAMGTNIVFSNAASGTAGNTISFTERLRIAGGGMITLGNPSNGVLKAEINNSVGGHYFVSQCDNNQNGFEIYQQHGATHTRAAFAVYDNKTGSKDLSFKIDGAGWTYHNTTSNGTTNGNVDKRYNFGSTNNSNMAFHLTTRQRYSIWEHRQIGRSQPRTAQMSCGENGSNQGTVIMYSSTANADVTGGVNLTNGATSWSGNSDMRLKNKTGDILNALEDINKIEPLRFTWKYGPDNNPHVGVSAQSVENVVPEAIDRGVDVERQREGDETEYMKVRYTELIPLSIAAIKELKAEVESLKAEIASLKGS